MKSHTFIIKILKFFVLITSVYAYDPEYVCGNVTYLKLDVQDKPELIVIKSTITPGYPPKYWSAICYVGKNDYLGRLTVTHDNFFDTQFEYDSETHSLYKGNSNKILKISLNDQDSTILKFLVEFNDTIKSVALDWVTKNLYYLHSDALNLLNLDNPAKIPVTLRALSVEKNFLPVIKVLANHGYLVIKDSNHTITRFNQDGSSPMVLYNNSDVLIYGIAVDQYDNRVYWLEYEKEPAFSTQIRFVNLMGGEVETFEPYSSTGNITYNTEQQISVDSKYVYFVTLSHNGTGLESSSLKRAQKDGQNFVDEDFEVVENKHNYTGKFGSVLVLGGMPQNVREDHPCKNDNGGCDGFCVPVPGEALGKKCIDTSTGYMRRFFNWFFGTA